MIGCYLISSLRVSDRFQHGGFNLYLTALALFKYSLVLWQQDCTTNSWWWWKADRLHERMVALSTPSLSALSSPETLRQQREDPEEDMITKEQQQSGGTATAKEVCVFTGETIDHNSLYWRIQKSSATKRTNYGC